MNLNVKVNEVKWREVNEWRKLEAELSFLGLKNSFVLEHSIRKQIPHHKN